MSENLFKQKYLKYKQKYLELKGGKGIIYDLNKTIIEEKQPLYIKAGVMSQKFAPHFILKNITEGCNKKKKFLPTDEKKYNEHRKLIEEYDIDKKLINCNEQKVVLENLLKKKDLSYDDLEKLNTLDLQKKCLTKYNSKNDFFIREKLGLPDINEELKNSHIVSAADAYCTMFENEKESKKYWIKGKEFTIQNLLYGNSIVNVDAVDAEYLKEPKNITIMRLAPGHYHRFHCPVTGTIESIYPFGDSYYSVQPYIVNSGINVYTENKRCVVTIKYNTDKILKMIIVGATCVGSIEFNKKLCPDNTTELVTIPDESSNKSLKYNIKNDVRFSQNEELGNFNFGGSTILYVINSNDVSRTEDGEFIFNNSKNEDETSVVVGTKLFNIK
jgi:phosphatidylserine decarboxylase